MDLTPCFVEFLKLSQRTKPDSQFKAKKSTISAKLKDLVASITYMRDYLVNNKRDYINI